MTPYVRLAYDDADTAEQMHADAAAAALAMSLPTTEDWRDGAEPD
ncbi:MAG TPA: hypothetical protein VFR99_10495 [Marmoricola sp.]|nr:hypothetical protein [Marmoricola sp.]